MKVAFSHIRKIKPETHAKPDDSMNLLEPGSSTRSTTIENLKNMRPANGIAAPERSTLTPVSELLPYAEENENFDVFEVLAKRPEPSPANPDLVAAEENTTRKKEYFTEQAISDKRVQQNEQGQWHRLINPDLTQEGSAYVGVLYDSSKSKYWITSTEDEWIPVGVEMVKNYLEHDRQISGKNYINEAVNMITRTSNVRFATSLAGYSRGVYSFDGRRILVTDSPKIINPIEGRYHTIANLIHGMFGEEQEEYLFGWLQHAYRSLALGKFQPGHFPCFVGPRDCGKTLRQHRIITPILGGREARPYQYMTAQSTFNGDMFKAEHLIISDETPAIDYRERIAFGSAIKQMVSEESQRMHEKGKDAIVLEPFWRVSMSLNDEPENLMVLPPMEDSLLDKMMLFKVARPDCLPDGVKVTREQFGQRIREELPAFVHYIAHQHQIRSELQKARFGIKEYCNPLIQLGVEEISPEESLMGLIDAELFKSAGLREDWEGTAADLSSALKDRESKVAEDAKKLITSTNRLGSMLAKIERNPRHQGAVSSRTIKGRRVFKLFRRYREDRE